MVSAAWATAPSGGESLATVSPVGLVASGPANGPTDRAGSPFTRLEPRSPSDGSVAKWKVQSRTLLLLGQLFGGLDLKLKYSSGPTTAMFVAAVSGSTGASELPLWTSTADLSSASSARSS